jgi:hypothetical protein
MARRIRWTPLIVVGGLSAGAGLWGGGAASLRERADLKARNAELSTDVRQARELAAEIDNENQDFRAQLARVRETLGRRELEIAQWQTVSAPADVHPPMILDFDAVVEARIGELECEVAALKEQQQVQRAGVPGPALPDPADPVAAPPVRMLPESAIMVKERCSALTLKGSRCSRTARSGGKCWQHGG